MGFSEMALRFLIPNGAEGERLYGALAKWCLASHRLRQFGRLEETVLVLDYRMLVL